MELALWNGASEARPEIPRVAPPTGSGEVNWSQAYDSLFVDPRGEAYIVLDAQLRAVELLSDGTEPGAVRSHTERGLSHVSRVREALSILHRGHGDAASALGTHLDAYLAAGHMWCRKMLEELRCYVTAGRDALALAKLSYAFVNCFLDPLFRQLLLRCQATPELGDLRYQIPQSAGRVQAEILCIRWESQATGNELSV